MSKILWPGSNGVSVDLISDAVLKVEVGQWLGLMIISYHSGSHYGQVVHRFTPPWGKG